MTPARRQKSAPVRAASAAPPAQVDEFEILRPLGQGSMGQVYEARDTVLGRPVAVKLLAAESPSPESRQRFLTEARAIARLQHPNVLSIYRVGICGERPYLVEELLSGKSLDLIELPLPFPRALDVALQLSRGLAAAHRQSVLHRDIKPANVILTDDGTAKLLDFGLAKLSDNLSTVELEDVLLQVAAQTGSHAQVASPVASRSPPDREAAPPAAVYASVDGELVVAQSGELPPTVADTLSAPATVWGRRDSDHSGLDLERAATLAGRAAPSSAGQAASAPRSATVAGAILGTPLYMAPEAWRGEPASAATDVYSLGALLYELCTGKPPHDFQLPDDIRAAALGSDARPLGETADDLEPRFATIIDRCLRRDPAARFASAEELQRALEALASELATPTARAVLRQAIRRRWPVALALTLVVLLPPVVALNFIYHQRAAAAQQRELVKNRRSVAVLGLAEAAPPGATALAPPSGFSVAFADLLSAELVVGERLRRIPAESVARMKIDLKLAAAVSYPPEVLSRIHKHLGADLLVAGSLAPEGERLRIHIEVIDGRAGTSLAAAEVSGRAGELFELVTAVGGALRKQLGLGTLSSEQAAALRAVRPESPHTAQQYAEGRDRLRRFDAVGARKLLEKVITADPDYPLGHLAMAEVLTALGYDEKAKAEARRALEMSSHLPREDRYLIEARYREATKEWDQAIATYQSLLSFFPESLDYGLYLGNAHLAGGQPEAALATAKQLRQRAAPGLQDPRLDILEARATSDAGDPEAASRLLAQAARLGELVGAPLLVAKARLEAAYTLEYIGQHKNALENAATAHKLFTEAGDRSAAADALMAMGAVYMYQGDFSKSLIASQQALTLLLSTENASLTASHLSNMALLLCRKGQFELAISRAEAAMLLAREIGNKEALGAAYVAIGWASYIRGDFERSQRALGSANDVFLSLNDPKMVAWVDWHLGQLYTIKGELDAAERWHTQALTRRETHKLLGFMAESQVALAAIALERRQPAAAAGLLNAAIKQFALEAQTDNEAWAQMLLAEAELAQHQPAAAKLAQQRALSLLSNSQNALIRIFVVRKSAVLPLLSPAPQQLPVRLETIDRELADIYAQAEASGILEEAYQARLWRYKVLLRQDATKEVQRELAAFAADADSRGFGLIAQAAKAALTDHQDL